MRRLGHGVRRAAGVIPAVFLLLAAGNPAAAQEARWRADYAAARKDAAGSGKPLLLDFGTETCFWCKKLDATTFRDRAVIDLLNERVVPVKVDGERDERLTQALGVQSFPTLVLVSPAGKVIARHEGYADVAKMTAFLRQVAPPVTPKLATRSSAAAEELALARADHDAGRYLTCIERCDRLLSAHAAGPEAAEARRLLASVAGDPAKWRQVTRQLEADLLAVKRDLDAALGR
jgi:thioredoxin-related protein